MCGIAGIVSLRDAAPPPSLAELEAMVGALRHRGPDEFGLYRDARAGLGHARLSIIDLATGQQPLSNEDGSLWIVFNGEIFNYLELREELLGLGHRFRTRSDTEVIVHAWEAWGEQCVNRFRGMFAFALWDRNRETLFLARDRLGVKPLYVGRPDGKTWIFGSELTALERHPGWTRRLDPDAIAAMMELTNAAVR